VLDGFEVGRKEAEEMIMSARVLAGWITPEDLQPPEEETTADAGEEAEASAPGTDA
jgi:N utilization substance protein A